MNWKKLIGLGVLFWGIMFIVWSVLVFMPGLNETWQWIIGLVANAVVALCLAHWYFCKAESKGFGKGLLFGLVVLIIAAILDSVISVPLFIKEGHAAFFSEWLLWLGFVVVLIASGIAGGCKCKKCRGSYGEVKVMGDEEEK